MSAGRRAGFRSQASGAAWLAAVFALAVLAVAGCSPGESNGQIGDAGATGGRADGGGMHSGGAQGSGGATGTGSGGASATGGRFGSGGAGPGSGGATGSGGAGGAAVMSCDAVIRATDVTPRPLAGPSAKMRVRAELTVVSTREPTWSWQVRGPTGDLVAFSTVDGDPATIEFFVAKKGDYTLSIGVVASFTCSRFYRVTIAEACAGCFRFRFTPPLADDAAVPAQDVLINVAASASTPVKLARGARVRIGPVDVNNQYVTGYVQVVAADSGLAVDGFTSNGPVDVNWKNDTEYEVLVIPTFPELPPQLFSSANPRVPFVIDNGWFLTGSATDGRGAAVPGARVLLRAGRRPSSIGVSDPRGQFSVLVRPGVVSAIVSPPPDSGLPELNLKAGDALNLDADSRHLRVDWAPVTPAPLVLTVTGGGSPVAGARARAETEGDIADAARISLFVNSDESAPLQTLMATGRVWVDAITDATGVARFAALPPGPYRVTVAPPPGAPGGTLTSVAFTKTAGEQRATITLASPVQVTATVGPLPDSAGARVVARDLGAGLGADESVGIVGADGAVTLRVAPDRTYRLIAEPVRGKNLARTVLKGALTSGHDTAPVALGALAINRGKTVALTAVSPTDLAAERPVAGAAVQVFCVPPATACVAPDLALAEAVTGAGGSFSVMLPVAEP